MEAPTGPMACVFPCHRGPIAAAPLSLRMRPGAGLTSQMKRALQQKGGEGKGRASHGNFCRALATIASNPSPVARCSRSTKVRRSENLVFASRSAVVFEKYLIALTNVIFPPSEWCRSLRSEMLIPASRRYCNAFTVWVGEANSRSPLSLCGRPASARPPNVIASSCAASASTRINR